MAAGERIKHILDLEEEKDAGTFEVKSFDNEIVVSNVTFSYGEGEVLKDFSIKIKKGQKVALLVYQDQGNPLLLIFC